MTTDPKDAEIARLVAERRMIVSHATMGQTDGEGLSVNAISVKITALRNELYQDGAARAEKAEAALAEAEAAEEGAFMILAQTQAERDAQIARLTAELFEMTRSRDEWRNDFRALEKAIVGDTGLSAMTVAVQARLFRPRAEKAEAALSESQAREAALHHAITEASEPDFIWGAMDNVNDMDADLDEFAKAASRAIRAAVPTPADAQAALDARINAAKEEGRIMGLRMGAEIAQNRHEAWTDDSGVSCDVTACAEIAVAILAKIKETEK